MWDSEAGKIAGDEEPRGEGVGGMGGEESLEGTGVGDAIVDSWENFCFTEILISAAGEQGIRAEFGKQTVSPNRLRDAVVGNQHLIAPHAAALPARQY